MKSADYVVSFKLMKDEGRRKVFTVWVAYLPIRRKWPYGKERVKRNKVLYSKAAKELYSVNGNSTKFFLPTPIGVSALYGECTSCPGKVAFLSCDYYGYCEEMTLNVGDVSVSGDVRSKLQCLTGDGLMDFKVKLTNLFRENQGVFKAGWKLKNGYYDGLNIWDFHMGWEYYSGACHFKFIPNKNFK